jgi:hypothetical protein
MCFLKIFFGKNFGVFSYNYTNKIYVKNILPEKTQEYYFHTDEISENTYQDERLDIWTFLYSSDNFENAKNQYEIYI